MARRECAFALLAISCLLVAAHAAEFEDAHVANLGSDFTEKVADGKLYFIKFYAPWCGHCKRLASTWKELGAAYASNDKVVIAHVDCTVQKDVCNNAQIRGYPTLKTYFNGAEQSVYRGPRDADSFKDFIGEQLKAVFEETTS